MQVTGRVAKNGQIVLVAHLYENDIQSLDSPIECPEGLTEEVKVGKFSVKLCLKHGGPPTNVTWDPIKQQWVDLGGE